jgi:hypothetical protein
LDKQQQGKRGREEQGIFSAEVDEVQSRFTKISLHKKGAPRMSSESPNCPGGPQKPGECFVRPMTPEELTKYGPGITPTMIREDIAKGLGLKKIAERHSVSTSVIARIMERNKIYFPGYKPDLSDEPKLAGEPGVKILEEKEEREMPSGPKSKLTKERLAELLKQGKSCLEIGKEYYPAWPQAVKRMAIKWGLIDADDPAMDGRKQKKQKAAPASAEKKKDFGVQLLDLVGFIREPFPGMDSQIAFSKADKEILLAFDTMIEYHVRAELRAIQAEIESLREMCSAQQEMIAAMNQYIKTTQEMIIETGKFATNHRHMIRPARWSDKPEEIRSEVRK